MKITLKVNKSIDENAQVYFEKSKKAKKKLEGAKKALKKIKKDYDKLLTIAQKDEHIELKKEVKRKKQWFEKFYWFITTDDILIIGGRDATTNEIVIKKHVENNDLVLHTDMSGSPFGVIKNDKKENIPENTIEQAGDFICSYSRAWKMGLTTNKVFYVNKDQVTKEANPGEYLPKGSFMIRGKTQYIKNPKINFAVGIYKEDLIMAGPTEAIQKHCQKFVKVYQGEQKASDIAKKIQSKIGGQLDDIIRVLPAGSYQLNN